MQLLKARVQNGRLVLDEPTEFPEGHVVYLTPAPPAPENAKRAEDSAQRDEPTAADIARMIDEKELLAELRSLA